MNTNPYGLPEKVLFCKNCVQSNQRPSTSPEFVKNTKKISTVGFEGDICDACRYYLNSKSKINWDERDLELRELCNQYRNKDLQYDVLVPGSGGKDSIYVAHLLKTKYDMRPLTVTWAPHIFTEVGWKNLQSWIKLGFDNILVTPNYNVHSTLCRLAFKNLINPFQLFYPRNNAYEGHDSNDHLFSTSRVHFRSPEYSNYDYQTSK